MYAPVFQSAVPPQNLGDWWTLIRRLAGQLYDVTLPDNGRVSPATRRLQARLGVTHLPGSLLEWASLIEDLKRRSDWASEDLEAFHCRAFPEYRAVTLRAGSLNNGWAQWCVAVTDLGEDDPPVGVYGLISKKNVHALRRSLPRLPLTQFALHSLLDCAGSNYGWMGSDLDDPEEFLRSLPTAVPISPSFGSLRFMEGEGWLAYVCHGTTPSGRQKRLTLRFTDSIHLRDIPKVIRDQVQLKPSTLKSRYRREHRS